VGPRAGMVAVEKIKFLPQSRHEPRFLYIVKYSSHGQVFQIKIVDNFQSRSEVADSFEIRLVVWELKHVDRKTETASTLRVHFMHCDEKTHKHLISKDVHSTSFYLFK